MRSRMLLWIAGTVPRALARTAGRFRWTVTHPVRLAAIFLLLVWVGPVTLVQTDMWRLLGWSVAPAVASAEPSVIPAGMAMQLQLGTRLKVHLRDGNVLEGQFLGRALLDTAVYASRFAAHSRTSTYVPFALGDTLCVSLRDGREWIAPFAGYGELALLLQSPDEPEYRRVPFESAREIRGPSGDPVEPGTLTREFHAGSLPSAEALLLAERRPMGTTPAGTPAPRRVAVQDIEWVSVELPAVTSTGARSGQKGPNVTGIVVLSVVLAVVLVFVILGQAIKSGCRYGPAVQSALPVTTRPFDRLRGCYVGDPLAVAGPWPGETPDSSLSPRDGLKAAWAGSVNSPESATR